MRASRPGGSPRLRSIRFAARSSAAERWSPAPFPNRDARNCTHWRSAGLPESGDRSRHRRGRQPHVGALNGGKRLTNLRLADGEEAVVVDLAFGVHVAPAHPGGVEAQDANGGFSNEKLSAARIRRRALASEAGDEIRVSLERLQRPAAALLFREPFLNLLVGLQRLLQGVRQHFLNVLAAEVVIAGHDENILRLQSERLQDGLKKDFTSRLIFLRLSAKRHVAAEDAKINLAQRRVDVPPLAQVGDEHSSASSPPQPS